jgi:coproporphyrinogen III oxidase
MRVLVSLVSALAVLGTLYHGAFEQETVSALSLTRNEAAL